MTTVSRSRLEELFRNMNKARIGVIGDLMLDIYIHGTASRLSQEAPVPVLRVRSQSCRLGGAANVMHNLMSIAPGCQVSAFGITGDDARAAEMRDLLRRDRILIDGVLTDPTRQTTLKQRVIASGQQVVRMDVEDTFPMDSAVREQMTTQILRAIKEHAFDALILEDYAKGLLQEEMLQPIADAARENGIYTSLDPNPGHPMKIRNLSLMTPNRLEAFGLAGIYCPDPAERVEDDLNLRSVADKLLETWTPSSLLVTLGHQGMALFRKNEPLLVIPTVAREVFDVCGAGDTVISVYTLCMAAGATEFEAAQIANHAAGIVVGKSGTATTTQAEVLAAFEAR